MTDKRIKELPLNYEKWTDKYYNVQFYCTNCGNDESYLFPKGQPKKGVKVDCSNCGCEGEL